MELKDYKARINEKNEIQLASTLIVLIERIECTKRAINEVMVSDTKKELVDVKSFFDGSLYELDELLFFIDMLI